MSMTMLTVESLSVDYQTRSGLTPILDKISISLAAGEIIAIWGASGCGKSTFLRAIAGLPLPSPGIVDGRVTFEGKVITPSLSEFVSHQGPDKITKRDWHFHQRYQALLAPLRQRGDWRMLFQEPVYAFETGRQIGKQVREILTPLAKIEQCSYASLHDQLAAHVALIGRDLADMERKTNRQLSGGECQWLALGLALAGRPKLLLADEPTTAIAPEFRTVAAERILACRAETGLAVILASHNREEVRLLADRVLVFCKGQLVESFQTRLLTDDAVETFHPYTRQLWYGSQDDNEAEASLAAEPAYSHTSCPYVANCSLAPALATELRARCHNQRPQLQRHGDNHEIACFAFEAGITAPERLPQKALLTLLETRAPSDSLLHPRSETLHAQGVSKSFRTMRADAPLRKLFESLELSITTGSITGLIGHNGAGKSTLARILVGVLRSDAGTVEWKGQEHLSRSIPEQHELRRSLRYIPQNPDAVLLPELIVSDAFAEAREIPIQSSRTEQWQEYLLSSGLISSELYPRRIRDLSLGQKRRVISIRGLLTAPQLAIFDEPFNGLDLDARQRFKGVLQEARVQLGMGILIISHDHDVLREVCSKIYALQNGRILPVDSLSNV